MRASRIIGWLLLLLAILAAGAEIVRSLEAGSWQPLALGYLWFTADAGSLNLVQAVVERYLLPSLWDPVAITILRMPTWLVLAVPAVILLLISRRRKQRRWFAK